MAFKSEKLKRFGLLVSGYSFSIFFNQFLNLILIPIYWKILTPDDLGKIAISQMVQLFLIPLFGFSAMDTIQRFFFLWKEDERPHRLGWFFWIIMVSTLCVTVLLDFFGKEISPLIIQSIPFDPYIRITIWALFLANILNFPMAICRIRQRVWTYNLLVNGSYISSLAFTMYFVLVEKEGALGYLKGQLFGNLIFLAPVLYFSIREIKLFPDPKHFFFPFRFIAPLGISGFIEGFSLVLDRYFLEKIASLAVIGFYDQGRKIGSILQIINTVAKLVLLPYIYKINAIKNNVSIFLGHAGLTYSVVMAIPLLGICLLSKELILILDPTGRYLESLQYVPVFSVSIYLSTVSLIMGRGMDLTGRTKYSFIVPLSGVLSSLICYLTVVPKFGVLGILAGVFVGSFFKNLASVVLGVLHFHRKIYLGRLMVCWVSSLALYFAGSFFSIDNLFVSIIWKLFVVGVSGLFLIRVLCWHNIKELMNLKLPDKV